MSDDTVSIEDLERFVRQLSHDWRNALGNVDLNLLASQQMDGPAEKLEHIHEAQKLIQQSARQLSVLSRRIMKTDLQCIDYPAISFLEDLQMQLAKCLGPEGKLFVWQIEADQRPVPIDFAPLASGLAELFHNALQHTPTGAPIPVIARLSDDALLITLDESKEENPHPENWSRRPLQKTGHGHYGLGLFHATRILAAHGGTLDFTFDDARKILQTTIRLPCN